MSGKDRLGGKKTLQVTGFLEELEIDAIKKNVDIIQLLESFGVGMKKVGKGWNGFCPFHEEKTPSFSVDREDGLFHCFGCGEKGNIAQLVMKLKGIGFREAMNYLKEFSPSVINRKGFNPKGLNPKEIKESAPTTASGIAQKDGDGPEVKSDQPAPRLIPVNIEPVSLNIITQQYHKNIYEHPEAVEYLQKRGFRNPGLYEHFQIGYSDGSLPGKIGQGQKRALIEAGILNGKGNECFYHCIIFPIFDENQQTVGFYGRDINDDSDYKHRYLKGPHRGVWNRKASKVHPEEIILTECIIDAFSLFEIGLENVQPLYGANGFTDEHLETLKADRVKTIVLALDNDESGRRASESLKDRLISEGFKVKIIFPWQGKDWNEMLAAGRLNKGDLIALIKEAAAFEKEPPAPFQVRQEGFNTIFSFIEGRAPLTYKVSGAKESFVTSLRVNIRVEYQGERYFDNLDLYSARSRAGFTSVAARQFGLESKRIEKDLITILEYFEEERDKQSREGEEEKHVMTEDERRAGIEFLKSPNLLQAIIDDLSVLGYVGEELNKLLMYLCASSRVMDNPISILVIAQSAAGKTQLSDTVKKLVPPEDVVAVTSLSDQALNYHKDLIHKFLILGEAVHSDQVELSIREMLSGKELSRMVVQKDQKTGKMETKSVGKPTIVASVMSSTSNNTNPENASRCFVMNIDESKEQTRRIHEAQRKKYSIERYIEIQKQIPQIIKKHQAAQRLLKNIVIINPFGEFLGFPDTLMRTRRDNDRFIDLIACVCFLRQYQKEVKHYSDEVIQIEYIECDIEDYRAAYDIMVNGVLASSLLEIPTGAAILYEEIRRMVREQAVKNNIKPDEVSFIQRDIREYSKFNADSIKKYLKTLVGLEYIQILSGRNRGTRFSYRLRKDEELEKIDLSVIPTPEAMAGKLLPQRRASSGENTKIDAEAS